MSTLRGKRKLLINAEKPFREASPRFVEWPPPPLGHPRPDLQGKYVQSGEIFGNRSTYKFKTIIVGLLLYFEVPRCW